MRAVFRADASPEIGIGHVMRCLTLADALAERGFECALITNKAGLSVLPSRRLGCMEVLPETAAPAGTDIVVVDHYRLDQGYERAARRWAKTVVVIDDLASRAHDCDVLLDTAIGRTAYDYANLTPPGCDLLLGPRFALLRLTYRAARKARGPRAVAPAQRLLVTLGGTDPKGFTPLVLDGIRCAGLKLAVDLVLPAHAQDFTVVRTMANAMGATVYDDADDLSGLMAAADLCIGSGGTTAWERACLCLPTIMVEMAPNQHNNITHITAAGAAMAVAPVTAQGIATALRALAPNAAALEKMSLAAGNLCDGKGSRRVAEAAVKRLAGAPLAQ